MERPPDDAAAEASRRSYREGARCAAALRADTAGFLVPKCSNERRRPDARPSTNSCHMRERLELRPVGFRPVAVEMGRRLAFLGRDVVEAGGAAMPDIIEAYRPTLLLVVGTTAMHSGSRSSGHSPRPRLPCDVPEYVHRTRGRAHAASQGDGGAAERSS